MWDRNAERTRAFGEELALDLQHSQAIRPLSIERFELKLRGRMRRSGDEQRLRQRGDQRGRYTCEIEAGESLRKAGRTRVEKAWDLDRDAGERFEFSLRCAVANQNGFAGIDGRLNLRRAWKYR